MNSIRHPFSPLYDGQSRILILGSFPSVKSREQRFFYGHPQNRFWRVLAQVFGTAVPASIDDKKEFLHNNHIALWDTIASCEISGSSDSSIKNAVPNDLTPILDAAPIENIYVNGRASEKYYKQYQEPLLGRKAIYLPSTSPANAAWSVERLAETWKIIYQ